MGDKIMELQEFIDHIKAINDDIIAENIILIRCKNRTERDELLSKLTSDTKLSDELSNSPLALLGRTLNKYVSD